MRTPGFYLVPLILLILTVIFATPSIENDGLTYYVLAKSLARDGDLKIDYDPVPGGREQLRLAHYPGVPGEKPIFSGGYALAYYPFVKWLSSCPIITVPAANLEGYKLSAPRSDALAVLLGSLVFGLGSIVLTYRILIRRFDPFIARRSVFLLFIGTPLIYYTFSEPSFAHAVDTFMIAMAFFWMDRSREDSLHVPVYIILAGFFCGLSLTVRNVNIPMLGILAVAGIMTRLEGDFERGLSLLLKSLLFAVGLTPFILFQLHYNRLQYGSIGVFGYMVTGVIQWKSYLLPMLFSFRRGLFIWSPLIIISVFGWILLFRRDRWLCLTSSGMVIAFFATAQFFPHWWGGTSFGLRFATHLMPLLAPGLAAVLERFKKSGMTLGLILAGWTFVLFVSFTCLHHSDKGLQAIRKKGSLYTPMDILVSASREIKGKSVVGVPGKVVSLMAKGYAPALIPNLLSALNHQDTILITGLNADFDLTNPYLISGRMKVYATNETSGTITLTVWPYLDKDENYRRSGISAIFEIPVRILSGFQTIYWTYDTRQKLSLTIPGYSEDVISRPLVSRAYKNDLPLNLHLEMGIFSRNVPRILSLDLEREKQGN